jgi:hypothetical protein
MATLTTVDRVIARINEAEHQAFRVEGNYANGGEACKLLEIKYSLVHAPNEAVRRALLDHYIVIGALPPDVLRPEG